MRITPLEIRQKTFEKIFRGYDKDEVTAFLTLLSQEWEKISDEKKMLELKYEQAQKESEKLKQVEGSLFRTLKSAEDTGAAIIEEANKTAELIINDARTKAEALTSDADKQARQKIEAAESHAKAVLDNLKQDVSALIENYETLLAQREIVIKNLKSIAAETLETVKIAEDELEHIDITAHAKVIEELDRLDVSAGASPYSEIKQTIVTAFESGEVEVKEETFEEEALEAESPEQVEEVALGSGEESRSDEAALDDSEPIVVEKEKKKESGSFFDQFD
ncbi:MAG TPA: DivIVA domain-containing protein [Cyclobacteriaceae bacterium]|nr:DivIVA domain-containing protein [Cyclobacteriaceae bacterium]